MKDREAELKDEIRVEIEDLLALMRELHKVNGDDHWRYQDRRTGEILRVEYKA